MFGQTFDLPDIPRVAVLAFLEILLSADNAIVLGLISHRLPLAQRARALYIGFLSAWVFRLVGLLGISYLLEFIWLRLLGGLYLIYLSLHHFIKPKNKDPLIPPPTPYFWKTILVIELFDLAFAIDSLVAGVAFIGPSPNLFHPKLWIVYIGGMVGVFAIRYAAHLFSFLIHRFPRLETSAYAMIAWIGLKLGLQALSLRSPYFEMVFWVVLILLFLFGLTKRKPRRV